MRDKQNTGQRGGGDVPPLTVCYSLADQSFERTKSLGILNLSVQLAEELARSDEFERFTLFSNRSHARRMQVPARVAVQNFDHAGDSGPGRLAWDQWQCYSAAQRSGNRWLFLPKGFASFVRKPPVKLALYVHDAMQDFYARRYPHVAPRFERWYFARSLAASLRHADIIFTNSDFTRGEVRRLARELELPEPHTVVTGIGFDATPTLPGTAKAECVVVLVGRWMHKRSDLALAWLRTWLERSRFQGEVHLVGSLPEPVTMPAGRQWRHHVRLAHEEYHRLLCQARAVVYFSEYEGFGMPPVEATIAGACPVFSDLPATREVMQDTGLRFSNSNFESFNRALNAALSTSPDTIAAWRDGLLRRHMWRDVVQRVITGLRESDGVRTARPLVSEAKPGAPVSLQTIHIGGTKRWVARRLDAGAAACRVWGARRPRLKAPQRSVLILEPFGLGDVISHEPMVRLLQREGYDVTFCARPEWQSLFPGVKWVNSEVAWGRHSKSEKYIFSAYVSSSFRRFLGELRSAGKGAVGIDTRGDIRSVLLLYAAGCREVITLSCYLGSDLRVGAAAASLVEFSPLLRRWESNLHCAQPLGLDIEGLPGPSFPHLASSAAPRAGRTIGLIPIAPWEGKWWEPAKWRQLSSSLRERGWNVRGFCGPGQKAMTTRELADDTPITECGSVLEWAQALRDLSAVVVLDSGPMHLADALGVPVIALFGQGLLPLWAPSGPFSRVVTHQNHPDFRACSPTEENTENARQWMRRIEVGEVLAALEGIEARTRGGRVQPVIAGP